MHVYGRVKSHSQILPPLVDSAVLPSGENATEYMESAWPLKVRSTLPVATSHSLSVGSRAVMSPLPPPPERAVRPSGEKATELTLLECPLKVRIKPPVATSHSASLEL
jgi:hypothetical protein